MGEVLAVLAYAATLAATMAALAWLGARVRRRGIGGRIMGPVDELFHPLANRFRQELETQQELQAPMPSPDDQWGALRRQLR